MEYITLKEDMDRIDTQKVSEDVVPTVSLRKDIMTKSLTNKSKKWRTLKRK